MEYEFPEEIQDEYRSKGMLRAECERLLLLALFNGYNKLELSNNLDDAIYLNKECKLDRYADIGNANVDKDYFSLIPEAKFYYRLLMALDALVERDLVSSKIKYKYNSDPFEEPFYVERIPGDIGRAFVARALFSTNQKDKAIGSDTPPNRIRYLHGVDYELTEKGYDVALIFFKHQDEIRRFEQQTELNKEAVKTSKSAAKIAKFALGAAIAIAISSLGTLGFNIYQALCQP